MRPLEQYVTLRPGQEALRQQAGVKWRLRVAMLRKWYRKLAHWLGIRLVTWGHKLEQVGTFGDATLP
jgi:hypothetical protein